MKKLKARQGERVKAKLSISAPLLVPFPLHNAAICSRLKTCCQSLLGSTPHPDTSGWPWINDIWERPGHVSVTLWVSPIIQHVDSTVNELPGGRVTKDWCILGEVCLSPPHLTQRAGISPLYRIILCCSSFIFVRFKSLLICESRIPMAIANVSSPSGHSSGWFAFCPGDHQALQTHPLSSMCSWTVLSSFSGNKILVSSQFGTSFPGTLECKGHCVKTENVALSDSEAHRWLSRRCLTLRSWRVPVWFPTGDSVAVHSLRGGHQLSLTQPLLLGSADVMVWVLRGWGWGLSPACLVRKQRLQSWMAPASPGWSPGSLISPEPTLPHCLYSITLNSQRSPSGSCYTKYYLCIWERDTNTVLYFK